MGAYLIIGASAAGLAAARMIRKLEPEREIVVLSTEKRLYSRCMLHKLLARERNLQSLEFESEDFFHQNNIHWIAGKKVTRVHEDERYVDLDDGSRMFYEKLLIASGAGYYIPPIPNFHFADNVIGFRELDDFSRIEREIRNDAKEAVVIGGGILGLDAATGLLERGIKVTVVEKEPRIMPLQTDEYAAARYHELFEKAGCRILTGMTAKDSCISDEDRITSISLHDGTSLPCDFVVVAASVKPQIDFLAETSIQALHVNYHINTVLSRYLRKTGIQVSKGLEVNLNMETTASGIYAAGDVTGLNAIWPDARFMGELAAQNMCGCPVHRPERFVDKNAANFYGLCMISIGKVNADPKVYEVQVHKQKNSYKRLVIRDEYLEGALLLGDLGNAGVYQYLIQNHISIAGREKRLFQLSFADWYGIDETSGEFVYQ